MPQDTGSPCVSSLPPSPTPDPLLFLLPAGVSGLLEYMYLVIVVSCPYRCPKPPNCELPNVNLEPTGLWAEGSFFPQGISCGILHSHKADKETWLTTQGRMCLEESITKASSSKADWRDRQSLTTELLLKLLQSCSFVWLLLCPFVYLPFQTFCPSGGLVIDTENLKFCFLFC